MALFAKILESDLAVRATENSGTNMSRTDLQEEIEDIII